MYIHTHTHIHGERRERKYNSPLKERNSTNGQNTTVLYKLKMNYTSKESPKSPAIFDNHMDLVV